MRLLSVLLASAVLALLPLQAFAFSSGGAGETDLAQAPRVGLYVTSAYCGHSLSELQGSEIYKGRICKAHIESNWRRTF
jgi:hypothetical protein